RFPTLKVLFDFTVPLENVIRRNCFFTLTDQAFPNYNGNWIVPNRLAAMKGPQILSEVPLFLEAIFANDIRHIIAAYNFGEVCRYFLGPTRKNRQFGDFKVKIIEGFDSADWKNDNNKGKIPLPADYFKSDTETLRHRTFL